MSIRQPVPLWILGAVLLVSVAAGQLTYRRLHSVAREPRTVREVRERLEHSSPDIHVVRVMEASEEAGVYLCTAPQPREKLHRLLRNADLAQHWKGVVFCAPVGRATAIPPEELQSWGEHAMQLEEIVFFGDPILLEAIRNTMYQGRCDQGAPVLKAD
jgi:hypothetical protein